MFQREKDILNATWININRTVIDSKTMVILDGSSSMYWTYNQNSAVPIDIATSLAILFAEQLKGPF